LRLPGRPNRRPRPIALRAQPSPGRRELPRDRADARRPPEARRRSTRGRSARRRLRGRPSTAAGGRPTIAARRRARPLRLPGRPNRRPRPIALRAPPGPTTPAWAARRHAPRTRNRRTRRPRRRGGLRRSGHGMRKTGPRCAFRSSRVLAGRSSPLRQLRIPPPSGGHEHPRVASGPAWRSSAKGSPLRTSDV
jgi:hypothetical protein